MSKFDHGMSPKRFLRITSAISFVNMTWIMRTTTRMMMMMMMIMMRMMMMMTTTTINEFSRFSSCHRLLGKRPCFHLIMNGMSSQWYVPLSSVHPTFRPSILRCTLVRSEFFATNRPPVLLSPNCQSVTPSVRPPHPSDRVGDFISDGSQWRSKKFRIFFLLQNFVGNRRLNYNQFHRFFFLDYISQFALSTFTLAEI